MQESGLRKSIIIYGFGFYIIKNVNEQRTQKDRKIEQKQSIDSETIISDDMRRIVPTKRTQKKPPTKRRQPLY